MGFYCCPYILRSGAVCDKGCYRPEGCKVHWNSPKRVPCIDCGKLTSSKYGACKKHAGKYRFREFYYQQKLAKACKKRAGKYRFREFYYQQKLAKIRASDGLVMD